MPQDQSLVETDAELDVRRTARSGRTAHEPALRKLRKRQPLEGGNLETSIDRLEVMHSEFRDRVRLHDVLARGHARRDRVRRRSAGAFDKSALRESRAAAARHETAARETGHCRFEEF